jgi:hypothetical protein
MLSSVLHGKRHSNETREEANWSCKRLKSCEGSETSRPSTCRPLLVNCITVADHCWKKIQPVMLPKLQNFANVCERSVGLSQTISDMAALDITTQHFFLCCFKKTISDYNAADLVIGILSKRLCTPDLGPQIMSFLFPYDFNGLAGLAVELISITRRNYYPSTPTSTSILHLAVRCLSFIFNSSPSLRPDIQRLLLR